MKKQALFIFTPGFPADEADTTCVPFLYQLCGAMRQVNPNIKIVVFAFQYPFVEKEYCWQDINVVSFGGKNKKGIARIFLWAKVIRKFISMQNEHHVIGIFSIWLTECAVIGRWLSSLLSLKHYTWIAGQDARSGNKYIPLIRPQSQNLIAISAFVAEQMQKNYRITTAYIISNGVVVEAFPQLKTAARSISILGACSLIPLKNLSMFIDVVEKISKHIQIDRVVLVGDGPERERLQVLIDKKGLTGIIEMTGQVPHTDVLQLMNDSRVFLHTSDYDANASVLHEALYAGCEVVSTCAVGTDSYDHFCLTTDRDKMTEEIIRLLSRENSGYDRVIINNVRDSAAKVLQLYTERQS